MSAVPRERRWEIAYWVDDPNDPILAPYWEYAEALETAVERAVKVSQAGASVSWIKVYPAANEADVRARWNPEKGWHELSRTAQLVVEASLCESQSADRETSSRGPSGV